jgi:hypothetical protein
VKLSAPPPPPPPPPDPPEPGQPDPSANENANAPTEANSPQGEAKPLEWPSWFAGADFLLAALAVTLAFLLASFVARNSDLWLHLAAGQRLLAGEYRPGTDPFSYSAADRAWVNHSLLFDAGAYLAYRISPVVLVVLKALAVAVAFGLLLAMRRPGYSLWPWAAVAGVAILAVAPRLVLNPLLGSMVLLSVTLFLLFRMPHRPNSWRFPIAIGITFWVWANVDQWFIIGPFALALVLVGELVQKKFWPQADDKDVSAESLGRLPDVPTLAKALGVGIVACMLNPHHVRVWDLPFELVGGSEAKADLQLRFLLLTPTDADYSASTPRGRSLGYNVNGLSYAALVFGGGALLGLAPFLVAMLQGSVATRGTEGGKVIAAERIPTAYLFLWVGFFVLSLGTIYAIPFFAIVSVPIIASQLNALSAGVGLKSWGDPKSRFLLLGSAGGRVLCVVAALVACVLAWPGWLHPESGNPAFTRRVAWGVQPDAGLVKAAQQLQEWRQDGSLPAETRGLISSVDLANYCAWFAPLEKVYLNGRYNHHRTELPTFVALRSGLGVVPQDVPPDRRRLAEQLEKLGVEYVVISAGPGSGSAMQGANRLVQFWMWSDWAHWSPWYLDGRSAVSGWRPRPGAERPTFAALRIDPVTLAFGRKVERLPAGSVKQLPPVSGWEDEFLRSVNISPAGADETAGWLDYSRTLRMKRQMLDEFAGLFALSSAWGLSGLPPAAMSARQVDYMLGNPTGSSGAIDDALTATPLLALRAARRAIAADPDHPDGYFALAVALNDPALPIPAEERVAGRVTALRQFLMRVPPPERYRRGHYIALPSEAAKELAQLYLGNRLPNGRFVGMPVNELWYQELNRNGATGYVVEFPDRRGEVERVPAIALARPDFRNVRVHGGPFLLPLDLARDTLALAEQYIPADSADVDELKRKTDQIREWLKLVDAQVDLAKNVLEKERFRRGQLKLADEVSGALQVGLIGRALAILTDTSTDLNKEFGRETLTIALTRVQLELTVGRLEDAAVDLEGLSELFDRASANPQSRRELGVDENRPLLRWLTLQKALLEGNYAEAGAILEQGAPADIGKDPEPTKEQRELNPKELLKASAVFPVLPAVSLLGSPSLDALHRQMLRDLLIARFRQRQQELNNRRARDTDFFWRRGFLFLLEGDVAEAKKRFERSRQPGVPEWGVLDFNHANAERYLRLIEQAEKK